MSQDELARRALLYLTLSLLPLSACAARAGASRPDRAPAMEITFEPMVVHASTGPDGEPRTVIAELPELFVEAGDYLLADDYANALRLYELILENFEDDEYLRASTYNSALSLEGLGRTGDAAARYRAVIEGWPATEDAKDAMFRLAECEAILGNLERVPPLMERVLVRVGLDVEDRVEAHLRWANSMLELRRFDEATEHYREAIRIQDRARLAWNPESGRPSERPLDPGDGLIAQTWFALGRVYHELFSEIRLVLPEERLTEDLVGKTQLFDQAQDAYLQSVRTGNPYWAPAAGYMVGRLFEDYYFDVLATEVPEDFDALEVEVYFEQLREFVRPAMERALAIYEHNLAMAYRLGADSGWVDDTLASLERVHEYLETREGWEDEHRQIVDRTHPHSAFHASGMQFRAELEAASQSGTLAPE